MESADQKFVRLIRHKLESNLNLVEKGTGDDFPCTIAIPESTFEKVGFDKQDVQELLQKYKLFGFIESYKMFSEIPPGGLMADHGPLGYKAYNFFSSIKPEEWENLYVLCVFPEDFENTYKQLFSDYIERKIQYNIVTGVGILRKKTFKFKDNQPEFFLFKQLYRKYNEPMKRDEVLTILKHADNKTATFAINELAKKIRTRTGLTPKELVLNNGNITLSI